MRKIEGMFPRAGPSTAGTSNKRANDQIRGQIVGHCYRLLVIRLCPSVRRLSSLDILFLDPGHQ